MTKIPDRPFDKIAIDLVTECKTSTSSNKHILTIIDHLTLSMLYATIVALSHLVQKVPSLELLCANKFNVRLV